MKIETAALVEVAKQDQMRKAVEVFQTRSELIEHLDRPLDADPPVG